MILTRTSRCEFCGGTRTHHKKPGCSEARKAKHQAESPIRAPKSIPMPDRQYGRTRQGSGSRVR
jgi:hypothetical protein